MSGNALISPKSENRKLNSIENLEFLEKLMVPDMRFEEFYLNKEQFSKRFHKMKKIRTK